MRQGRGTTSARLSKVSVKVRQGRGDYLGKTVQGQCQSETRTGGLPRQDCPRLVSKGDKDGGTTSARLSKVSVIVRQGRGTTSARLSKVSVIVRQGRGDYLSKTVQG